jgi:hypothetical protein
VLGQQLLDPSAELLRALFAEAFSQAADKHHGNQEQVQHEQHADHDVGDQPEPRLLACGDRQNADGRLLGKPKRWESESQRAPLRRAPAPHEHSRRNPRRASPERGTHFRDAPNV